jgi:hypothetical protein
MRLLKLSCVFACIASVIQILTAHDRFDTIWGIVGIIGWSGALYGIQVRAPATWKLGFIWVVVGGCAFLTRALSDVGLPNSLDRRIAVPFVVISTIAVTVYWGNWWYKQKSYFSR